MLSQYSDQDRVHCPCRLRTIRERSRLFSGLSHVKIADSSLVKHTVHSSLWAQSRQASLQVICPALIAELEMTSASLGLQPFLMSIKCAAPSPVSYAGCRLRERSTAQSTSFQEVCSDLPPSRVVLPICYRSCGNVSVIESVKLCRASGVPSVCSGRLN